MGGFFDGDFGDEFDDNGVCDILVVMKEFFKKLTRSKVFWIALVIIVQTVVYVFAGVGKAYYHMDEMHSYGLANYDRVQIYENDDFYNEWHDAGYYKDYVVVNEDERGDFAPVYNNQRDDVHPPLYYLLLRVGMELTPGEFTKWSGIIINILAFAVNTVFLFLIAESFLAREKHGLPKAFVVTLVAAISMSAISAVIYVRMYAMLAMFITVTAWLHLQLVRSEKMRSGLLVAIGLTALAGVLTQYYYIFFLLPLFIMMIVKYAKEKRKQELWSYVGMLAVAAVASLVIWPYSIQHMFFGYRGVGVMANLLNVANLGTRVGIFFGMLTLYNFNGMLVFVLIAMFALAIYGLKHGKNLKAQPRADEEYRLLLWPTLFFFVIASIASPFQDLRYIEPVCGLMTLVVFYGLYRMIKMVVSEGRATRIMSAVLAVVLVVPVVMGLEPNVAYSHMRKLNEFVDEHKELPAIYLYNPGNERFLDDLASFVKIDQSYIMHHQEYTEQNFEKILAGKDLKDGLIVFANYGDVNEQYLRVLREATGLENQEYIIRTNSSDVYLLTR